MKTLTLTQPFASLVAIGAKRIETRSWKTSYRGPLAIHAAKGFPMWAQALCVDEPFYSALSPLEAAFRLPRAVIVATCQLVDIRETGGTCAWEPDNGTDERAFGDYAPGRFMWLLEDVQPLPKPIPVKGALGLWEWEAA